ncbi:3-hydroxyisobutyrate dehydrogenase, partial [Phenoliferia sp. Uapishka_3]
MIPTRILRHVNRSQTLGFIGLGAMGRSMAANLLSKTFANAEGVYTPGAAKPAFVIYDAHQPAVDAFLNEHVRAYAGRDVIPASSPAGVARLAGTVFTMLPSSPQVEEVYLGENGIKEGIEDLSEEKRAESMFVDCTTLDQGVAKMVAGRMKELGAGMIDAPVSGGTVGAELGKLSFMCGGDEALFQRVKNYLDMMGSRSIYCGESGNGLAAKICNNLLLGISMAGTAEAMLLGASLGLSPELLASILNTSTGKCWSSELNNPAPGATPKTSPPADRDYEGGFLSKLMAKDLNLAISASKATSTPLPIGGMTSTLFNTLSAHEEFGSRDFSVVYEYLRVAREGGLPGQKKN